MTGLEVALSEVAAAGSIEELGAVAFRELARALDACPVFFAEVDAHGAPRPTIVGDGRALLPVYLADHIAHDPLGVVALAATAPVVYLERHVPARAVCASRTYQEFHRPYDFEHHMLVRCRGARALSPGAIAMGFTRGRHQRPFDDRDLERAAIAVAAFRGALRRIDGSPGMLDARGLTRAETRVIAELLHGRSNAEIALRLGVSLATVKTHLYRSFDKLGVRSRGQAIALLRS